MQTEETLPTPYRSPFIWPLLILGLLLLILAALIFLFGGRRAPRQLTFEDYLDMPASGSYGASAEGQRQPTRLELRTEAAGDDEARAASYFIPASYLEPDEALQEGKPPAGMPELQASTRLVNPCTDGEAGMKVRLSLTGFETKCEIVRYNWTATGGRITGNGREAVWDLSGAQPGIYRVEVKAASGPGCKCEAYASTRVGVRHCTPPGTYTPTYTPTLPPIPSPSPSPALTPYPSPVVSPNSYPTASPTPAYRPSPVVGPTYQPNPSPRPSPYAQPSASPSPYASPSPSAYPSASPGSPQRYKITVHYPDRFPAASDEESITLDLSRPEQQQQPGGGYSQRSAASADFRLVASTSQPPVATTEAPQVELYGKPSELYAVVRLVSDDLTVLSASPAEQHLDRQWLWRVKPARAGLKEAVFTFEMDFLRRAEGYQDAVSKTIWKPANPFRVPVGAWGAGYFWWPWWLLLLLLLSALAALLAALWLWRRPTDLCIDSICKADPHTARQRITHVSGLEPGRRRRRWKISTERAVEYIESGRYRFHTLADGYRANVLVRTSRSGNKFIQTEADADHPNNLLSLPELTE